MPDIDATIADGDPGHTLHHEDLASEVNSLRARVLALETSLTSLTTTVGQKATMPSGGWTWNELNQTLRALLVTTGASVPSGSGMHEFPVDGTPVGMRNGDAWDGDLA